MIAEVERESVGIMTEDGMTQADCFGTTVDGITKWYSVYSEG
jgi:hypothetical protein